MSVTMVQVTENAEKVIEIAGRGAYDSAPSRCHSEREKFIKGLIRRGHESVLEHASATFHIEGVSRAMTHQLVRHRLASYTQQSQRYVKCSTTSQCPNYVVPSPLLVDSDKSKLELFESCMKICIDTYNALLDKGVKKEDARFVLPNAWFTKITVTANFREWRHILKLRCDPHAQWEIQSVCKKILHVLYGAAPSCFEDIFDMYYIRGND